MRLSSHRWCLLILALVCLAQTAGCGRGGPALAKCVGIVTLDGQPLDKGSVQFIPDRSKGTSGAMATAAIGTDGRFSLRTFAADDGGLVGFHKVTVASWDSVPDTSKPTDDSLPGKPPPPKSLIPEIYVDPQRSGLSAEVKAGKTNEFHFELRSDARSRSPATGG